MARVRGTSFAGYLAYLRHHHGEPAVAAVLEALRDRELAGVLGAGLRRTAWYPFDGMVDVLQTIDRLYGKGDGKLVFEVGRWTAKQDLSTVYRIFFMVASIGFILERANLLWRTYYDSGEVKVLENEEGRVRLEVCGFETPHAIHCEGVRGWTTGTLDLSGAKEGTLEHPVCRARGGDRCLFVGTWRP